MLQFLYFSGYSDSGKTTLISGLIKELRQNGYRIGVVKHCPHDISIDENAKKDTAIFQSSGAEFAFAVHQNKALLSSKSIDGASLEDLFYLYKSIDLVFVEGFKEHTGIKIGVCSIDTDGPILPPGEYIAVVGDHPPDKISLFFKRQEIVRLAAFIEHNFL